LKTHSLKKIVPKVDLTNNLKSLTQQVEVNPSMKVNEINKNYQTADFVPPIQNQESLQKLPTDVNGI